MERPPLVEIKQECKTSIYTTDFYFTDKSPSYIMVPSPSQNNTTPIGDQAAAADPTLFNKDPLQPGEIHLHSWMLYTAQAPILYLIGKDIKSMKDIEPPIHTLNCAQKNTTKRSLMAEKKPEEPTNKVSLLQIVIHQMILKLTLDLRPQ